MVVKSVFITFIMIVTAKEMIAGQTVPCTREKNDFANSNRNPSILCNLSRHDKYVASFVGNGILRGVLAMVSISSQHDTILIVANLSFDNIHRKVVS